MDQFIYLGSNISSTESDVNIRIGKAWTFIDRLTIIWKSDLFDKINQEFLPTSKKHLLGLCGHGYLGEELYGAMVDR